MRKRRPSTDLTPREQEVLGLLRVGLTNEEIAHRLEITVAGAKYHVSQILSKLEVGTREEAAEWQPPSPERPGWLRLVAAIRRLGPLTPAKGIGVGLALAIVAAIILQRWDMFGSDETRSDPATTDSVELANAEGLLTMDQVLVHAGRAAGGPVEEAQVSLTTYGRALEQISDRGYRSIAESEVDKFPDDSPTWLLFLSTHQRLTHITSDSPSPVTSAPDECGQTIVVLPDALLIPKPRFIIQGHGDTCPVGAIHPRDRAILAAGSLGYLQGVLRDTTVNPVRADEMDLIEALNATRATQGALSIPVSAPYHSIEELERDRGEKVWLVRLTGSLYDLAAPPTTSASTAATPTSSPGPDCREFWVITRDGVPVLFTLLVKSSCS